MQASPFDEMAADYDASFTRTACAVALRDIVWGRLSTTFKGRATLLELGCGTGEDAIHLARAGHRVCATDASAQMILVARRKAADAGVAERIDFHVMPMEAIHTLPRERRFDGVYSNFGAVNCVADMGSLARSVAARLVDGAPLLFVAMGRHVPWEWIWYLARGDRARAFRRLHPDGVSWRGMRIRYPTPATLGADLQPWFDVRWRSALGCVLPPSYAAGWLDRAPRTLALLRSVERATARVAAGLADHFMIEGLRRRAN